MLHFMGQSKAQVQPRYSGWENKLHFDVRSWKYHGHDFQPATVSDQVNYKVKIDQVGKTPDSDFCPILLS